MVAGAGGDKEVQIEPAHCNECGRETKHEVVAEREQPGSQFIEADRYTGAGFEINWRTTYYLLECCGSEAVSVKRTHWFSENPETLEVEYFPPRVSRRPPDWLGDTSSEIQDLMGEIYSALQANSRRLAMMGARAVLDIFMQGKVGDTGGFQSKLQALEKGGYITTRDRKVLAAVLEAGNAAAHRGHNASPKQVEYVIDIVEHVLQGDLLEPAADELARTTPRRRRSRLTDI